jgi:tetratricopeptide (TPR) repeat protein
MQFKDTRAPMSEIGRVLGVDALVAGAIVRSGHRVRITAQLVEAAADRHLWGDSYERDLCDVLALQHDVAVAIASEIRASLAVRQRLSVAPPSVVNPEAYFAYIKGRACWDQRNERALLRGIDAFTQAVDIDPKYAAAYAGMADCYSALGYGSYLAPRAAFEHAAASAHKALALDPESADAEAALAYVALYYDWNFNEADRRFQRALAIDSNSVTAHHWYSVYLTAAGRVEDARTEIRHAQALDPLSPAIATDVGFGAYYAGRFDEAIASLRTVLAVVPNYPLAHLWLGRTYQEQGRFSDAVAAFSETLKVLVDWPVALAAQGFVFGVSGHRETAMEVLQRLDGLAAQKYVTEYGVALIHAGLGDRDAAFEWLDRAVAARSHWLVWLKLDPRWASLRSDRRFARLLCQIGVGR